MKDCCQDAACEAAKLARKQRSTLYGVLAINAVMFVVEFTAGLLAGSTALLADSLDMLGDTLSYAFSIFVVERSERWKAGSALFKGGIMGLFSLAVAGQVVYKCLHPETPVYETIGLIGALALATNTLCLGLLWRHRDEDINMSSVWLCSRNDIIANVSVLAAALGVRATGSAWPDLAVGSGIAALFLRSSYHVVRDAWAMLRRKGGAGKPGPAIPRDGPGENPPILHRKEPS